MIIIIIIIMLSLPVCPSSIRRSSGLASVHARGPLEPCRRIRRCLYYIILYYIIVGYSITYTISILLNTLIISAAAKIASASPAIIFVNMGILL